MSTFQLPKTVLSRDRKLAGRTTGSTHRCRLDGCTGLRITVRWPDQKITHPCSKGMKEDTQDQWVLL